MKSTFPYSSVIIDKRKLRPLLALCVSTLLFSCGEGPKKEDTNEEMSKFSSVWNIYEKYQVSNDGTIIYDAQPWGGLVGSFMDKNMPSNLSAYESITFEFAEPTPVATQVVVAERFKTWGKKGITSLICNFDGQDVTSVDKIMLQASDTCTLKIKDIYLTPNDATWKSVPVWNGDCFFGDWTEGLIVTPDKFSQVCEGDKLEFIYRADKSDPSVTYWLIKTIISGTDYTLEGNDNEKNEWGCIMVGREATVYRVMLTANDAIRLRERGLYANGYYVHVSQINILYREYANEEE